MNDSPRSSSVIDQTVRRWLPQGLIFYTDEGPHIFLANGSRVYSVTSNFASKYMKLVEAEDYSAVDHLLIESALEAPVYVSDDSPAPFPAHAMSLAIAQTCNLSCGYCYAQGGDFGGRSKIMSEAVALQAVGELINGVEPGERVNLAFLGGEPLANRAVLRAATEYAAQVGLLKNVSVGFSVTTNGTLVNSGDVAFFEEYGFAVTISLDGMETVHDAQRPFKSGHGSYRRIMSNIEPLLKAQKCMQVSARVSVTPANLQLLSTLEHFIDLGFHSVGFSPVLNSPTGRNQLGSVELEEMLNKMIECGRSFEQHLIDGDRFPFLNMYTALKEIHRGTHRPYPCGAGAGYFGVSAEGELFACHRFVDDSLGAMGSLKNGIDATARAYWLANRHVHFQNPCSGCWARYLCGGGCHHEVIHRGRPACEYIRGWLEYCLSAYVRLLRVVPQYFDARPDAKLTI